MNTPERPADTGQGENFRAATGDILSPDDEALVELIADFYRDHPNTVLSDTANEYDESVYELSKQLHGWSGLEDDEDSFMAVYSALNFALFVENVRYGTAANPPDLTHFERHYRADDGDAGHVMQERAAEYFRKHPSDKGIVLAFMPELDPNNEHAESVEDIYGFVLEVIETERELFKVLEQDVYQDVTPLCGKLVRAHEALLVDAVNSFTKKRGRQPDLNDEYDISVVGASIEKWFLGRWPEIKNVPMPGDTIVVSGRGIVMAETRDDVAESGLVCLPFNSERQQIRGTFKRLASQKYLDSAWLDLSRHQQVALGDSYKRTFGIHFVLENAILIDGDTSGLVEELYVPLHYPEMSIQLMRTAVPSDKA